MPSSLIYPYDAKVQNEQRLNMIFDVAPYSLKNFERTRDGIIARSQNTIVLPMSKEPNYSVIHSFGEGQNPVGPVISMAGAANSGGLQNFGTLYSRVMEPTSYFAERQFATDTYRRFANITELTMVSEARKNYYFEFIFVPKSFNESVVVNEIIGTFRKSSYPVVATGFPQSLWTIRCGSYFQASSGINSTGDWFGEPLPCVLSGIIVKHGDQGDPVLRLNPGGASSVIMLGLNFIEFETGSYVPFANETWSKSEISTYYFGYDESQNTGSQNNGNGQGNQGGQ